MRLENKMTVITGTGHGIERAYAQRIAEEGAQTIGHEGVSKNHTRDQPLEKWNFFLSARSKFLCIVKGATKPRGMGL